MKRFRQDQAMWRYFWIATSVLMFSGSVAADKLTVDPWDASTSVDAEKLSAKNGQLSAHLSLARRYLNGDGVSKDPNRAADHFASAALLEPNDAVMELTELADEGNLRAQTLLGRLFLASALPTKRVEGLRYLEKAGDAGSAEANFILASQLAMSPVSAERKEAIVRFARAERAGGKLGSYARFLRNNVGGPAPRAKGGQLTMDVPLVWEARFDLFKKNLSRSLAHWGISESELTQEGAVQSVGDKRLFELGEAAYSGDVVADHIFLTFLRNRCGKDKKIDRTACAAFVDGVESANSIGLFDIRPTYRNLPRILEVGKILELGVGGPVDPSRARKLYQSLADRDTNWPEAAYRLSVMLQNGVGGAADAANARKYLVQAADYGQPIAAYVLALERMRAGDTDGLGFYLKSAANSGNSDASYYYAQLLIENKITARDRPKAIFDNMSKAVAAGNKNAFYGMALVHWNGWTVPVDEVKAQQWWEKAARVGDPKAADHVAALYLTRRDPAGAIPWLRRAAQGGYPGAQERLDEVISKGYRERNLGGFLMDVFSFVGEVGEGMAQAYQAQYEREQAEIRRSMMFYVAPASGGSDGGSSSSTNMGTGGVSGSASVGSLRAADGGSSDVAQSDGDFSGTGDQYGSDTYSAGQSGFSGNGGVNNGSRGSTQSNDSSGTGFSAGGGQGRDAGRSGTSPGIGSENQSGSNDGGSGNQSFQGAIIVSTESADQAQAAFREAELARIEANAQAEINAANIQARYDKAVVESEAEYARARAEYAAKYAHCDEEGVHCVSPQ